MAELAGIEVGIIGAMVGLDSSAIVSVIIYYFDKRLNDADQPNSRYKISIMSTKKLVDTNNRFLTELEVLKKHLKIGRRCTQRLYRDLEPLLILLEHS